MFVGESTSLGRFFFISASYLTCQVFYYKTLRLCYNKHRNMTAKNYDYYLKKTKTDAEKRKQADPSKSARAESAVAAVFFLSMAWSRGLWMVTVAMLVLAIFAFFVPFYTKKSSSCPDGMQTILPCSNNYYYNFYGQELNY